MATREQFVALRKEAKEREELNRKKDSRRRGALYAMVVASIALYIALVFVFNLDLLGFAVSSAIMLAAIVLSLPVYRENAPKEDSIRVANSLAEKHVGLNRLSTKQIEAIGEAQDLDFLNQGKIYGYLVTVHEDGAVEAIQRATL